MGRELKRVHLNFEWPLHKPWSGFINPFYAKSQRCNACNGSGRSKEADEKKNLWYGYRPFKPSDNGSTPFTRTSQVVIDFATENVNNAENNFYGTGQAAIDREIDRLCELFNSSWSHHVNEVDIKELIKGSRLIDFTHNWTKENGWTKKDPEYIPSPEEVNNWNISSMGHDSINQWICTEAACKREGFAVECSSCKGECDIWPDSETKSLCENWEKSEPPQGEGYQVWETVSEGSPVSPVFSSPYYLARYMVEHDSGFYQDQDFLFWMNFILGDGWLPSFRL